MPENQQTQPVAIPKHWRIDAISYVLLHAMHILDVDDIHDAELPEGWQYHIDTALAMASEAWAHVHALPTADEVDLIDPPKATDLWEQARAIVIEAWEDEARDAMYPDVPEMGLVFSEMPFADFDADEDGGSSRRQLLVRIAYNRHVGILESFI